MARRAGLLLAFLRSASAVPGQAEAVSPEHLLADDACQNAVGTAGDRCELSLRLLHGGSHRRRRRMIGGPEVEVHQAAHRGKKRLSITKPDTDVLQWDNVWNMTGGPPTYNGWLRVPLMHDELQLLSQFEEIPEVCLRVRATLATRQPAKLGPLLVHCGGPGTGRDCGRQQLPFFDLKEDGQVLDNFDIWSIDQRGVNIWGSDGAPDWEDGIVYPAPPPCPFKDSKGQPIKPFPVISCDEIVSEHHLRMKDILSLLIGSRSSDSKQPSTALKSIIQQLLMEGDLPFNEQTGNAFYNEDYLRWYYRLVKLEHSFCYNAPRFKLTAISGRVYNMLQFAGTVDLANDIDIFREAIGASHMSLHGFSYGTSVAGVYGTMFPKRTKRLVMDGVVNPDPNVDVRGTAFAQGLHAVWNGIEKDCDVSITDGRRQEEVCPAAPQIEQKVYEMLNDVRNLTRAASALKLIERGIFEPDGAYAAVVLACLQHLYTGESVAGCPKEMPLALTMATTSGFRFSEELEEESGVGDGSLGSSGDPLDDMDNLQAGTLHVTRRFPLDRFNLGLQAVVMGTDTAGRLDEEAFITWWRRTKEVYPVGVTWATGWLVAMATWPADPRPVPPLGSADISPVIVGNLHDPNTAYHSAQEARKLFPNSRIVTWQGYGHCLSAEEGYGELLTSYKRSLARKRLPSYTNDVAKYLCTMEVMKYLATGELPNDGYSCLLAGPLAVGSKDARRQASDLVEELMS